jgi:hypothetical protein
VHQVIVHQHASDATHLEGQMTHFSSNYFPLLSNWQYSENENTLKYFKYYKARMIHTLIQCLHHWSMQSPHMMIIFLFVQTEAAAERALALNGADMGGRFLKIELCKVKPKAESEKQVHHEAPKKVQGCTSAYIGNLAWDVAEADLRKFFKKCKIDAIRFALDKDSGEFRGFGHIDFADDESLEAAVKLDQQFVCGRPLKIAYSVPKQNQRDRSMEQLDRTKQPKTCFTCNEPGHMSYNCPKKELV